MTKNAQPPAEVEALLEAPDLASALESEQFRRFLDQVPLAIAVSSLTGPERVIYANPTFKAVCAFTAPGREGSTWSVLPGESLDRDPPCRLGDAVTETADSSGTFRIIREGHGDVTVEAFSSTIEDDADRPVFRLVTLVGMGAHAQRERAEMEEQLRHKDTLLREIQHRVRNNLQMVTALIRVEQRNARAHGADTPFHRLAGRVEALHVLYNALTEENLGNDVDLGAYLSQIASAVMSANAVEGIRLDTKVDSYRVSVNVAMPTGLVVNELLTNALKHAFPDGRGGCITLHCLSDGGVGQVVVADDGVGLPHGFEWPMHGKLAALIVQSLRDNAKARLEVASEPGTGTRVTISFNRSEAA
jgi:two-component sensor histidine kinase